MYFSSSGGFPRCRVLLSSPQASFFFSSVLSNSACSALPQLNDTFYWAKIFIFAVFNAFLAWCRLDLAIIESTLSVPRSTTNASSNILSGFLSRFVNTPHWETFQRDIFNCVNFKDRPGITFLILQKDWCSIIPKPGRTRTRRAVRKFS